MPDFGGSKNGLTVMGKTASLIVRQTWASGATDDTEYDIADPGVWSAVARLSVKYESLPSLPSFLKHGRPTK